MGTMILHVALPVAVLMALAAALPHLLLRVVPETFAGILLNVGMSAGLLTLIAATYFFVSYLTHNSAILDLAGIAPAATLAHFLRLGLGAGLVWGPVLVLSVSYTPARWKENVW